MEILPARLDEESAQLVQPSYDSDPFIEVDAWAHFFEFTAASADPPGVLSSKKGKGTKTKGAKKSNKKGKKRYAE